MGIPRLIQTLQPFAERVIIGSARISDGDDDDGQKRSPSSPVPRVTCVVIDGPSLVYHIYHRLISVKGRSLSAKPHNPLLSQPAYSEINHAVLAFITYLHYELGVEVQKIYFDGALPASKKEVRLARLEEGRRKLSRFRELDGCLSRGFNGVGKSAEDGSSAQASTLVSPVTDEKDRREGNASRQVKNTIIPELLFHSPPPLPPSLKFLPPPPFMVPAAIEHLRSYLPRASDSAAPHPRPLQPGWSLVHMAAAEADPYCALHARRTGAAILTSDSDLLAYDLGPNGSVVFLNTLELAPDPFTFGSEPADPETRVFGTRYHAPSIISKLNVPSSDADRMPLQRFCFEQSRNATYSTLELKRRCLETLSTSQEGHYQQFQQHYSTDQILLPDEEEGKETGAMQCQGSSRGFQGLDPRLVELVVQFQQLGPPARAECMGSRLMRGNDQKGEIDDGDEDEDEIDDCDKDEDEINNWDRDEDKMPDQVGDDVNIHLPIFLPPLIEDPSRDSAWSYGRELRQLAYGLLARLFIPTRDLSLAGTAMSEGKKRGTINQLEMNEYHRRGTRIGCVPLDLRSLLINLDGQIEKLVDSIHAHGRHESGYFGSSSNYTSKAVPVRPAQQPPGLIPRSRFWHSFALALLTVQRLDHSKPAPGSDFADVYLRNKAFVAKTWDHVHDQASLEAVLYSLRILKQSTGFVVEYASGEDRVKVRALVDALESLPPITELMDSVCDSNISKANAVPDATTYNWRAVGIPDASLGHGEGGSASGSLDSSVDPEGSWVVMDETPGKGRARMKRTRSERGKRGNGRKKVNKLKRVGGRGENIFASLEEVVEGE